MAVLFETERLVVRRAQPEDTEALLRVFGDEQAMRHFGHGKPWSREELERFLAQYPPDDARLVCVPGWCG